MMWTVWMITKLLHLYEHSNSPTSLAISHYLQSLKMQFPFVCLFVLEKVANSFSNIDEHREGDSDIRRRLRRRRKQWFHWFCPPESFHSFSKSQEQVRVIWGHQCWSRGTESLMRQTVQICHLICDPVLLSHKTEQSGHLIKLQCSVHAGKLSQAVRIDKKFL